MMRKIALLSLVLLSGCMVGPDYERPVTEFAPEFTETEELPGAEVNLAEWWKQFDDQVLNEMIEEAIASNYDLRIAAERMAAVRANYELASANLWPEIDLNGTTIRQGFSQNLADSPFLGPPVQNFFQLGFDASWELDFFGRLRRLKEAAYFDLEASWENMRNVYITLLAEVASNYAIYRSLQQKIELTLEQIRVNEGELELSVVRYDAGLRSEIEPLQVKAHLDALKASLPPLEAETRQTLYNIAVLLGRQPEQIPENWSDPQPIPRAQGKIPIGLPSDLLRRRPDIRQAERTLAAATSRVGAAIAELYPIFSLTGSSWGLESIHAGNWFTKNSQSWNVGPNIFWPTVDFGRTRDRIDFQNAHQRAALLAYEQVILEALQEVEDALVAYRKEEVRLLQLSIQVKDLKQSRDLTAVLYYAGLASLSDVLQADQQVLFVQQSLLASEEALSEDLMAVYKSLGGDWSCCSTP